MVGISAKNAGTWKDASPYVKRSGVWVHPTEVHAKSAGSWVKVWPIKLVDVLAALDLTANLKLVLDATDVASYSGSGQSWLDRSGNGYDFFRGATSSATTDDPTFNGTAGSPSAYWSFDGGDFFRYDSANETWMNNLHKAGLKCTVLAWYYPTGTGVNNLVCGTLGSASGVLNPGFWFGSDGSDLVSYRCGGVASTANDITSSLTVTKNAWNFIGASVQSGVASGTKMYRNSSNQTFSFTLTTPSSSPGLYTMDIGSRGNGNSMMPNGSRIAMVAAWEGVALTQEEIDSIFQATRGGFGI